jgi:hypothetical protein
VRNQKEWDDKTTTGVTGSAQFFSANTRDVREQQNLIKVGARPYALPPLFQTPSIIYKVSLLYHYNHVIPIVSSLFTRLAPVANP